MGNDFTEYALQIPRIKKLVDEGWKLFLVDYVADEYLFERYKKVTLMSGGVRNKRKVKKVYMRKTETAWFSHLAQHLTHGWSAFSWKEHEKNYTEYQKDAAAEKRAEKTTTRKPATKTLKKTRPPTPPELTEDALRIEAAAEHADERRDELLREARWQAEQKPKKTAAAKPRKTTKKPAKPKTKKPAATTKLTPAQHEYLATNGFVMVKRGGKYVRITG